VCYTARYKAANVSRAKCQEKGTSEVIINPVAKAAGMLETWSKDFKSFGKALALLRKLSQNKGSHPPTLPG